MHTLDVVIPVHTPTRPIARAVASVLGTVTSVDQNDAQVLVVCHNIEAAEIAEQLGVYASHPNVKLLELRDGVHSPAGPLNYGVLHATAKYVTFLGSDDEFELRAVPSWIDEVGTSSGAGPDLLIGRLGSESGGEIRAPFPRAGKLVRLDVVRDLLNYRTAPVGVLIRTSLLHSDDSPGFIAGMRTGEDIALGLYLWNTAQHIDYSPCASGYLIREDSGDRATTLPLPASEILAPLRHATKVQSLVTLPLRKRQAIGVKLLRHQLVNWLLAREKTTGLDGSTVRAATEALGDLTAFAPGARGFLTRGENQVLHALAAKTVPEAAATLRSFQAAPAWSKIVSSNPFRSMAPEGVLRGILRTKRSANSARRNPARIDHTREGVS